MIRDATSTNKGRTHGHLPDVIAKIESLSAYIVDKFVAVTDDSQFNHGVFILRDKDNILRNVDIYTPSTPVVGGIYMIDGWERPFVIKEFNNTAADRAYFRALTVKCIEVD